MIPVFPLVILVFPIDDTANLLVCFVITYRVVRETMFVGANGDRPLAPNYLVLITDGRSNNRSLTWFEAMTARLQSITILVVCQFQISYEFSEELSVEPIGPQV